VSRRLDELLRELESLWDWLPEDRREQVAAALRRTLDAAPVGAAEPRLGETGNVVLSRRALDEALASLRSADAEETRVWLTDLLLDARRQATGDWSGERWRARRKGGWDVTARVGRSGRIAVVTSVGEIRRDRKRRERER